MKRQYVTPIIVAEKFSLTQSIAACGTKIGFLDSECVINDLDATEKMRDFAYAGWFMSGHCTIGEFSEGEAPEGMGFEDGLCYHTNAQAVFNS